MPSVTTTTIATTIRALGLTEGLLCVHASLRSFGHVEGGAAAVVAELLGEGCTVLVPTFSWDPFAVPPPPDMRPARNGWRYDVFSGPTAGIGRIYTPAVNEIDAEMGAIPAAVLAIQGRVRGDHPLCSFSAVGPRAQELIARQAPLDVFAPLRALAGAGGAVICMGVGLNRLTLLHLAEQVAGRRMFRRWANGADGLSMEVEVGGCSEGFERLVPALAEATRTAQVGASVWRVLPASAALARAAAAIRADPTITHCGDPACGRCQDAVLGGPTPGSAMPAPQ